MRVFVVTGAGVSAESGIPTFRGKKVTGEILIRRNWRREAFVRDPNLVWDWYRERRQRIRKAEPNPAHHAIAKLAEWAGEFLLVTQNLDDLHRRYRMGPEVHPPRQDRADSWRYFRDALFAL
jgi:NAD-dependent deacetylase